MPDIIENGKKYEIIEKTHEPEEEDDDEEDDRVKRSDDDDDSELNDESKLKRERRRQEKKDRKERREQAMKRDKLELDFLRKRNDDLERRVTAQEQRAFQGDINSIEARIAQATRDANMAEQIIAKAIEAGNGDDVAQALRYRDQARDLVTQLSYQKQRAQSEPPKQQQIDDMTMHYAKKFMDDNPWYDAQGRDEDSAIVMAIDQALAKDGYDPRSEEYWDELRRRSAKRIPERFEKKTKKEREPKGGPAIGSGKEHAPASTRKEIYISPERKQALIEAGVWDDSVLRAKYIKRYAEYDKNNRA